MHLELFIFFRLILKTSIRPWGFLFVSSFWLCSEMDVSQFFFLVRTFKRYCAATLNLHGTWKVSYILTYRYHTAPFVHPGPHTYGGSWWVDGFMGGDLSQPQTCSPVQKTC